MKSGIGVSAPEEDFRAHLSPSLQWRWKLQDFAIVKVTSDDGATLVSFRPKYRALLSLAKCVVEKPLTVSAVSSMRLAFIVSIIAAGRLLKKPRKDGEVIARDLNLVCRQPIIFDRRSTITVSARVSLVQQTDQYHVLASKFSVGLAHENPRAHTGSTRLLYCAPNLQGFSYLQ